MRRYVPAPGRARSAGGAVAVQNGQTGAGVGPAPVRFLVRFSAGQLRLGMPAFSITADHFSMSDFNLWLTASGVLGRISMPSFFAIA